MRGPQDLLREYAALNRLRANEGVTPLEYQRWAELRRQLQAAFPQRPPPGIDGEARLKVEFPSRDALKAAVMFNVRPIGIFVNTPFALKIGERVEVRVHLGETEVVPGRMEVVSNNVGPDFSTAALGMGMRFLDETCALRALVDSLCVDAAQQAG